jgi:peptide methionine sulfoxide reductase MsrA
VDKYLDNLKKMAEHQKNQLLQRQTMEYLEYIKRLVEYADIMEKKFYVIVPYDKTIGTVKQNIFKQFWANINPEDSAIKFKARRQEFETLKKGLTQRVNQIKGSLESIGLKAEQLSTQQLVELFYNIYNPLLSRNQKIEDITQLKMVKWE